MPEYQELPSNKERLNTLMLPSASPSSPNSEVSSLEKKAEVNLLAGEHGECEGRGTSGKQSLRRRICQFRSFNINSMHIVKVIKNGIFVHKFYSPEVEFQRRHGAAAPLWPLTGRRETRRQ